METTAFVTSSWLSQASSELPWSPASITWILVVGFVIAFVLAFAVGANDVANSFGTTVGAKVLTLQQACILATVFETTGAVLLGAKVGETIRKGIIDVTTYDQVDNGATVLMLGELSAMFGAAVWQLIATLFKLPVSGTHSIVGACIGFSLVAAGSQGVNWYKLGFIVASWFLSPVLSGIMSVGLFAALNAIVLKKKDPVPNGLRLLPFFYSITIGINVFSILFAGAPLIGLDNLLLWQIFVIAASFTLVTWLLVFFIGVPIIRKKIDLLEQDPVNCDETVDTYSDKFAAHCDSGYETPMKGNNTTPAQNSLTESLLDKVDSLRDHSDVSLASSSAEEKLFETSKLETAEQSDDVTQKSLLGESSEYQRCEDSLEKGSEVEPAEEEDSAPVRELFSSLQVLTACFASFAHGGNDVSNAISPLVALWIIFWSGEVAQKSLTPWYLLIYGGVGISVGLWILGRRVIETIGSNLTKVTPSRGFCIELMTAITVLIASNVGLPVSTTHCKVGAVVSIGWLRSRASVDWKLVGSIALAWFVTVPVSGLLSAAFMWILMHVAL